MNQDSFYRWTNGRTGLALVCDGMGGAKSGNVASAMAAQRFAEVLSVMDAPPVQRLQAAAEAANSNVYQRAIHDPDCYGMGTTLVSAFARDDMAYIINIGDSRCYHISKGDIWQVTRDHSLVAELVAMGRITPEEAQNHPNRNIITRALGTEATVSGDIYEEALKAGDCLLLCSDGLSNEVTPEEMLDILTNSPSDEWCSDLLELTLERGAPDNVTVVILEADGPRKEPLETEPVLNEGA